MAKKENLKTDKFNIDSELDFGDFDLDEIDHKVNPDVKKGDKSRKVITEVFKGTISGAMDELKNPSFIAKVTKDSLPSSYGEVFKAADTIGQSATQLYDEAVKEIKPQVSRIAKKVDRLVPEEQKSLKKITSKISNFFGGDEENTAKSKEQLQDQGIANALSEVFGAQQKFTTDVQARQNAEGRVKEEMEGKRFESNYGLLSSISESGQRLAGYTEKVTQAFQKKSLELQFRSYFVQNELLQNTVKYFEVFKNQHEAIAKNTGLPDYLKITMHERMKDSMKNKFAERTNDFFFGGESMIGKGLKRIGDQAKEFIGGVKEGMEAALMGVDMASDMSETMGDIGVKKSTLAGNMIGGKAMGWVGNKASGYANKFFENSDKAASVRNFGNNAAKLAINPQGAIHDLRAGEEYQKNLNGEGLKGKLMKGLDWALSNFQERAPDLSIANPYAMSTLGDGAKFDQRTQRSIVEVIPGYLAQIWRELSITRTGDEKTQAPIFDFTNGKFSSKAQVNQSMRQAFSQKTKSSIQGFRLDQMVNEASGGKRLDSKLDAEVQKFFDLVKKDNKVEQTPKGMLSSKQFQKLKPEVASAIRDHFDGKTQTSDSSLAIKKFFLDISKIPNMEYSPENIRNTEAYEKLDAKTKITLEKYLSEKLEKDKDASGNNLAFSKKMLDIRGSTPDVRFEIERFVQTGYGDILEENGVITREKDGNYKINEEAYHAMIDADVLAPKELASSDKNVKRNARLISKKPGINKLKTFKKAKTPSESEAKDTKDKNTDKFNLGSLDPKNALKAIKNTGVYKWFYKQGKGDDVEHTGPMAQDVQKNMGEEAGPGGTKIDLVTMNGNNMAAIQALSDKQDANIGGEKNALLALRNISKNSTLILNLLTGKGKVANNTNATAEPQAKAQNDSNSYEGILGRMFGDVGSLLGKGAADLGSAGMKTAGVVGKGVVKGIDFSAKGLNKIYDRLKGPVASMAGMMLNTAGSLATKTMEIGSDALFDKLPKAVQQAKIFAEWAKDGLKRLVAKARDVYVKGEKSPVIKAALLKAGYYRDQATGKIIRTMGDLKNLKGNVVNAAGEVILTIEDAAKGLVDNKGEAIKTGLEKLANWGKAQLFKGLGRAGALLGGAAKLGGKLFGKLKDMKFDLPAIFSFGTGRIHDVLVEIRDLIKSKLKGTIGDESSSDGASGNTSRANSLDSIGDKVSKAKGALSSLGKKTGVTARLQEKFGRAKEFFRSKPTGSASEILAGSESMSKRDRKMARKDAVKAQTSTGQNQKSFFGKAKDKLLGLKEAATPGVTSAKTVAKGKIAKGLAAAKGFKGKALGFLGGLMGGNKDATSEEPKEGYASKSEGILTKVKDKAQELAFKAKDKALQAKDAIKGKLQNKEPTFNDKDGDGKRDGNANDRIKQQEERSNANRKDPLQMDKAAKYRGENVIDAMMKKAGALLDMAKGGMTGILDKGASMISTVGDLMSAKRGAGGLAKGAAGAAKGAGSLLGKIGGKLIPGLGIAYGAYSVADNLKKGNYGEAALDTALTVGGTAIATGTTGALFGALGTGAAAIAGLVFSPVVLSALAVGAVVGGLGYLGYKLITRNDVTDLEQIRMYQYGLTKDDKDFNHYMLNMEEYLLTSGRVVIENGKAETVDRAIKIQDMLKIFSIDEENVDNCRNFGVWYSKRFKPFFLSHLSAMYKVNSKVQLNDIKKFTDKEKISYLGLIGFDGGPYGVLDSPFKDKFALTNTKELALAFINKITDDLVKKESKKITDKPEVVKGADVAAKAMLTSPPKEVIPKLQPSTEKKKPETADPFLGEEGQEFTVGKDSVKTNAGALKLKMAQGPMRDGSGADQYLKLAPGVTLDGLNPQMLKNLRGMAQEYGEATGKSINITSGVRDKLDQEALYRKYPNKAAKPGTSLHEIGLAIDIDSKDANALDDVGLMRKYGFTRPVGGEPWHTESAGIQANLSLARKDPNFAQQAIAASIGKGGGGVGSMAGSELGRRNPEIALAVLNGTGEQKVTVSDKDAVKTALDLKTQNTSTEKDAVATLPRVTITAKRPIADNAKDSKLASLPNAKETKDPKLTTTGDSEVKPADTQVASDSKPVDTSNRDEVKKAIMTVANKNGADGNEMALIAAVESSLNPNAKSNRSSASGPFQFTNDTWKEQMGKNARKYNLDANASPTDINASTLMATEYFKANRKALSSVKANANLTDVYLAHFLGAQGAKKFLSAKPDDIASVLFPTQARSNPDIFFSNGSPLTIAQVYGKIDAKLSKAGKDFGISIPSGNTFSDTAANAPSMNAVKPTAEVAKADTAAPVVKTPTPVAALRNASTSGAFKPQSNTIMTPSTQSSPLNQQSSSATIDYKAMTDTLTKQLDVQTEMRDLLKDISEKVTPIVGKVEDKSSADSVVSNRFNNGKSNKGINSAVDIARKVA